MIAFLKCWELGIFLLYQCFIFKKNLAADHLRGGGVLVEFQGKFFLMNFELLTFLCR